MFIIYYLYYLIYLYYLYSHINSANNINLLIANGQRIINIGQCNNITRFKNF